MAIRQDIPPLPQNAPLVDPNTGMVTIAFQRWWQQVLQNSDTAFGEIDGKVPESRLITATAPIRINGGASADLSEDRTLSHADTAVTPGSYTSAGITVDQKGHLTAASSGAEKLRISSTTTAPVTYNVNSTTYIANASHTFRSDMASAPWTEYRLIVNGSSNAVGATITGQLATFTAPTTPIHTGGDDVTITNTSGSFDSGWLSRDVADTGAKNYCVVFKGSTATVDLNIIWIDIWLR